MQNAEVPATHSPVRPSILWPNCILHQRIRQVGLARQFPETFASLPDAARSCVTTQDAHRQNLPLRTEIDALAEFDDLPGTRHPDDRMRGLSTLHFAAPRAG